ncbi:MAG: hypothetical protein V2I82_02065 [Halieaceae bacterium]|jgi:hypothetical protein|nr:hypothetical protein [Halieaceae bacterium]
MPHRNILKRLSSLLLVAAVGAQGGLVGGCATKLPCLEYGPQSFTRTISMHGHGSMQVTEERLVCTVRDTGHGDALLGP